MTKKTYQHGVEDGLYSLDIAKHVREVLFENSDTRIKPIHSISIHDIVVCVIKYLEDKNFVSIVKKNRKSARSKKKVK